MKILIFLFLIFLILIECNKDKENQFKNSLLTQNVFQKKEEKLPEVSLKGLKRVFSFSHNIFLSHLYKNGLYIPAGDLFFLKYTGGKWKTSWHFGENIDGKRTGLTNGLQGILRVSLQKEEIEKPLFVRFSIKSLGKNQFLSFFLNEVLHPPSIEISEEWKIYEIPLKKQALKEGENTIRFHFRKQFPHSNKKSSAAFEFVEFFNEKKDLEPIANDALEELLPEENSLNLSKFKKIRFFLYPPSNSYLYFVLQGERTSKIQVKITDAENMKESIIFDKEIKEKEPPFLFNLENYSEKIIALDFINHSQAGEKIIIKDGGVFVKEGEKINLGKKPENVVFWLIDALRADKLKAYNTESIVKSPNIDRIAREGIVFKSVTVQGSDSIPSHSSIITSLYPRAHGHENNKTKIKPETILPSQIFKKNNHKTALFSSNGYVSEKWGFNKGWDMYRNFIRENLPGETGYLLPRAIKWLEENINSAFFLYTITADTHVPYRYRKGFTDLYDSEPYKGPVPSIATGYFLADIKKGKVKLTERDKKRLIAQYDGQLSYNDYNFGKLLNFLEEKKILEKTLIIITSDHGDEFFEHNSVGHGHTLYQELIGVPLIFWAKNYFPNAKIVDVDVESIDIFPTIYEIMGIKIPPSFHGISLLSLIADSSSNYPRPAISRMGALQVSLKIGDYKYIMKYGDNDELYSLKNSFFEKQEIKEKFPLIHRYFRDIISFAVSFEKIWEKSEFGFFNNHNASVIKKLRNIKF